LIRSSSVWLVFSTLRYQASLVGVVGAVMVASSWSQLKWMEKREGGKTKTAGLCSVGGWYGKVVSACAFSSHPPGTEIKNQK
jgi:hypothetical protein